MDSKKRILETIAQLLRLPHLEPAAVAKILDRVLQPDREDDYIAMYRLVGGPALPFCSARVFWMKKRGGGEVFLEIPPEAEFAPRDLIPDFMDRPGTLVEPDVRGPMKNYSLALRIPVGEMIVNCPTPERKLVREIILTESPRCADWEGDAQARAKPSPLKLPEWHELLP